ncbi:MAG: hypothetical protein KDC07_06450 [Chitinophagaceae bacterium]|nr:hypothetical protein [Chitinophagaceae bacterium]MCB9047273.1 hypothetical protein [Chitinophagales bacterium]
MKRITLSAILAISFLTSFAQNAGSSGAQTADLNLSNALEISFTDNSSSTINVQFNSLSDMINGVETSTHEIRVRSNKKFKVTVKPSSNNFSYSGSSLIGTLLKVSTVMKIQVVNNNTGGNQPLSALLTGWQNFSVLGLPVTLLNNCNPGNNQTFTVKYKATPGVNCVAGNYTTDMVYTATQQ